MNTKEARRNKRKLHIRKSVSGTAEKPRLSVYRSNAHIFAQLIDDVDQKTLAAASDLKIKSGSPIERAAQVGKQLGELAAAKNITKIVFDRGGYKYHGRVKSLADGAREAGLEF